MFEARENETTFQHLLRLAAQASDVACLAIILLFLLGEDWLLGHMSIIEWTGFLFFPIGLFVGLVLAWHEEVLGGLMIAGSVAGFYLVYGWLLNHSVNQGWALLPFLIPAVLFIAYGMTHGSRRHAVAG